MKNFSLLMAVLFVLSFASCSEPEKQAMVEVDVNAAVNGNIKKYSFVWDEIMNKGKLDMFNDSNFTADVVMHVNPEDIKGIDSARAYYANFLTGFSNIDFKISDIFGQDDKLVKVWSFKGKHTGAFFGIPASGKEVSIVGTTVVRMSNGKIAEEQDYFDNLEFFQQLGLIPR